MRLLRLHDDDTFSLSEYFGDIPPYAILSHTWGADDEEVTFNDIVGPNRDERSKPGYDKLYFCARQAAKDKLDYFWIDTCCIEKTSSAELSEAINSMFRWYQNAAKCYVFLADVSMLGYGTDSSSFEKSRWFTRGWTLQELVAPPCVQFFSADSERIGNRKELMDPIIKATGIAAEVLQGCPLSHYTIEERKGWAAGRHTKREEDAAYSLLGIFGVHIPLLYGEGRERAMLRLLDESLAYERRSHGVLFQVVRDYWPIHLERRYIPRTVSGVQWSFRALLGAIYTAGAVLVLVLAAFESLYIGLIALLGFIFLFVACVATFARLKRHHFYLVNAIFLVVILSSYAILSLVISLCNTHRC